MSTVQPARDAELQQQKEHAPVDFFWGVIARVQYLVGDLGDSEFEVMRVGFAALLLVAVEGLVRPVTRTRRVVVRRAEEAPDESGEPAPAAPEPPAAPKPAPAHSPQHEYFSTGR